MRKGRIVALKLVVVGTLDCSLVWCRSGTRSFTSDVGGSPGSFTSDICVADSGDVCQPLSCPFWSPWGLAVNRVQLALISNTDSGGNVEWIQSVMVLCGAGDKWWQWSLNV